MHGSTGGGWKRNATASPRQSSTQPTSRVVAMLLTALASRTGPTSADWHGGVLIVSVRPPSVTDAKRNFVTASAAIARTSPLTVRRPPRGARRGSSAGAGQVTVFGASGGAVAEVEVEQLLLDEQGEVALGGRSAGAEALGHLGRADGGGGAGDDL